MHGIISHVAHLAYPQTQTLPPSKKMWEREREIEEKKRKKKKRESQNKSKCLKWGRAHGIIFHVSHLIHSHIYTLYIHTHTHTHIHLIYTHTNSERERRKREEEKRREKEREGERKRAWRAQSKLRRAIVGAWRAWKEVKNLNPCMLVMYICEYMWWKLVLETSWVSNWVG